MDGFKIVATKEKRSIYFTLIPHKWEDGGMLYWPQHLKFSDREILRSDPDSVPDQNQWQQFDCIVKCSNIATFKEGINLEKRLTECIDSDAEEQVFNNTLKNPPTTSLTDRNNLFHGSPQEEKIIILGQDFIQNAPHSTPPSLFDLTPILEDMESIKKEICCIKQDIKQQYAKININLDKLYKLPSSQNTCLHKNAVVGLNSEPDVNLLEKFRFPLSSCEEMLLLNEEICTKTEVKSNLITLLSQIGGTSGEGDAIKIAYKVIDFLVNPDVLINYSWTGVSRKKTSERLSFQTLESILTVIFDVLLLADNCYTRQKNNNIFKDCILKHAKKRSLRRRIKLVNNHGTNQENGIPSVESVEVHVDADFDVEGDPALEDVLTGPIETDRFLNLIADFYYLLHHMLSF